MIKYTPDGTKIDTKEKKEAFWIDLDGEPYEVLPDNPMYDVCKAYGKILKEGYVSQKDWDEYIREVK